MNEAGNALDLEDEHLAASKPHDEVRLIAQRRIVVTVGNCHADLAAVRREAVDAVQIFEDVDGFPLIFASRIAALKWLFVSRNDRPRRLILDTGRRDVRAGTVRHRQKGIVLARHGRRDAFTDALADQVRVLRSANSRRSIPDANFTFRATYC